MEIPGRLSGALKAGYANLIRSGDNTQEAGKHKTKTNPDLEPVLASCVKD